MINEAYVSFEVAKLLKEKGFDCPCHATYDTAVTGGKPKFFEYDVLQFFPDGMKNSDDKYGMVISAPTHQMTMKWLREVHNIQIELNWDKGNQLYSFQIWKLGKYQAEISSLDLWRIYKDDNYLGEWNYEDAVEAALKYCLENLI